MDVCACPASRRAHPRAHTSMMSTARVASRTPSKFVMANMNPNLVKAEYAVRGAIVLRSMEIKRDMEANPGKYPFDKIVACNIGNPQELLQKPISYNRQVSALVACPWLLDAKDVLVGGEHITDDVIARAHTVLENIGHRHKTGAYTESQGYLWARESIAAAIERRDGGVKCCPTDLFLTDGASPGIKVILNAVVSSPSDTVMLPIPQYPLYSATMTVLDGQVAPYYLDENHGWSLTLDELEASYDQAVARGGDVKALVVINPGNPTGQVMSEQEIRSVCEFAARHGLLLLADEVYQENVYDPRLKFTSFKKICASEFPEVPLVSFHSISKGVMGECGKRGGYMELCNVPKDVKDLILKVVSINLCSNVTGQLLTELMMNPPTEGDTSYPTWRAEYDGLKQSLARRAKSLVAGMNAIPGISTNGIQGSMYAFPSLDLPPRFLEEAQAAGKAPDAVWSMGLLEEAGILVVPGSGFGQKPGTHHFRTTILPPEDEMDSVVEGMRNYQTRVLEKYQ